MSEKPVNEREMSVDEYLATFPESSADYQMVKKRAENLKTILVTLI